MTDASQTPPAGEDQSGSSDAWRDVGRQFESLGASLAQAVRAAWNDEENRRRVQEMQTGLEAMVRDVGEAINETVNSPKGQEVTQDVQRAADNLVEAGEKTVQEVRPHLMKALEQLNTELQKLVDRMNRGSGGDAGA